jgi:hypothetical protein
MMSHAPYYILKYELPDSQVNLQITYTPLQAVVNMYTHSGLTAIDLQLFHSLYTKTNSSVLTELHFNTWWKGTGAYKKTIHN